MATISAVVASAFIGAIATGIVTLLVRELRSSLNTVRKRERLRDALIGEIESGQWNAGSAEIITEVGSGMIPTTVFENNTADIGLFTGQEIQAITAYYGSARKTNAIAERVTLNPEEGVDPDKDRETHLADAYYSEREYLIENGDEAISMLKEHRSEDDLMTGLLSL